MGAGGDGVGHLLPFAVRSTEHDECDPMKGRVGDGVPVTVRSKEHLDMTNVIG